MLLQVCNEPVCLDSACIFHPVCCLMDERLTFKLAAGKIIKEVVYRQYIFGGTAGESIMTLN